MDRSTKDSGRGRSGLAVFVRLLVFLSLTVVGLAASAWAYQFGQPDGPILYWGILPGAPFVLLAVMGLFPRVPVHVTLGAAAGSLLAVALPYGALLYASANYTGGGANIGLGLLLLATPIFLPIAMLIGGLAAFGIGRSLQQVPRNCAVAD